MKVENLLLQFVNSIDTRTGNVACFGAVDKNMNAYVIQKGAVCHWGLRDAKLGSKFVLDMVVKSGLCNSDKYGEEANTFFNWMLNDSSYAKLGVFYSKEIKDHVYAINTDVPGNLLGSAIVSMRTPTEFPDSCRLWHKLVKDGVEPHFAFVLSMLFFLSGGKYELSSVDAGHRGFRANHINMKTLNNFINGVVNKPTEKFVKTSRYTDYDYIWGKWNSHDTTLCKTIEKYFTTIKQGRFGQNQHTTLTYKEVRNLENLLTNIG